MVAHFLVGDGFYMLLDRLEVQKNRLKGWISKTWEDHHLHLEFFPPQPHSKQTTWLVALKTSNSYCLEWVVTEIFGLQLEDNRDGPCLFKGEQIDSLFHSL